MSAERRKARGETRAARQPWTIARVREVVGMMASERQDFVRITANTLVFNLGAWLVMPLYTILFVKQLDATDSWIGELDAGQSGCDCGVCVGARGSIVSATTKPCDCQHRWRPVMRFSSLCFGLTLILVWGV